jgi:uncharacterized protein (DUF1499 family)
MNIVLGILVVIIVLAAMGAALVRLSSDDPARWHVDPMTAARTGAPNDWLLAPQSTAVADGAAPVWQATPATLMQAIDALALAQPNTALVARGPDPLMATYVQRSALMRYPDYISVRALPAGEGRATLAIFSRSRYGQSDLGVNAKRVSAWLVAIPLPQAAIPLPEVD